MASGQPYPLAHPNQRNRTGAQGQAQSGKGDSRKWADKAGHGSRAYISDEGPKTLHDVGAVVALEYHVQVHEDPLVLFLVPRASHLLHRMVWGGEEILSTQS